MSNKSTNCYQFTTKFWLYLAQQAELQGDLEGKKSCLEEAMKAAMWEEKQ
jgi:hypothetical protein